MTTRTDLIKTARSKIQNFNEGRLPGPSRIVLNHGVIGQRVRLASGPYRGPLGMCFANTFKAATMSALKGELWRYCEGYAFHERFNIAFPHAWLIDAEDNVLETTWRTTNAIYMGVTFVLEDVAMAMDDQPGGMLHDDWARSLHVLRSHELCCREQTP